MCRRCCERDALFPVTFSVILGFLSSVSSSSSTSARSQADTVRRSRFAATLTRSRQSLLRRHCTSYFRLESRTPRIQNFHHGSRTRTNEKPLHGPSSMNALIGTKRAKPGLGDVGNVSVRK